MKKQKIQSTGEFGINRIALWAFGLLIAIPYIGILYLFWEDLTGKWLPLIFLLILSALGFYLFWAIVKSITSFLKGLESVSRGESDSVQLDGGTKQMREISEIIDALNKVTGEFKENAAKLENLIEQFTTLSELTEITSRIPDINELLELVMTKAMNCTQAKLGTVMLLQENGEDLEIVVTKGWTPSKTGPISLHETLCKKVIESGEPLLAENIEELSDYSRPNDSSRYSSPSFLIMPLNTKTKAIGVVCLSEKGTGKPFNKHDQQFLTVILSQIGFAVENAQLLAEARQAADQLRKAQHQIIQTEKLSALGEIIAGVAHEINNPLTTVCGYIELLLKMDKSKFDEEKVHKMLLAIYEEAIRATKIVRNLLSFARESKPETTLSDINEIIEKVVELRQYDLRTSGIELTTDLECDLTRTMLDPNQIQQVILNLVNNSVQALSEEGPCRIQIGTHRVNDEIELWVSDTGCGIPKVAIGQIFDPFFSTKKGKTSCGMGLSVSYGIIKQHGGTIHVDSTEGQGTTMTVRLSIVADSEQRTRRETENIDKYEGSLQDTCPPEKYGTSQNSNSNQRIADGL